MRRKRRRYPAPPVKGFYLKYLEKLIVDSHAKGEPAPDAADQDYWSEWRKNNNMPPDEAANTI